MCGKIVFVVAKKAETKRNKIALNTEHLYRESLLCVFMFYSNEDNENIA